MDIHKVEPDPELLARARAERIEVDGGENECTGRIRPFVVELANRGSVRAEEWAIGMNSYERDLLTPHLLTEVFAQQLEHCLRNCERRDGVSYDDALVNQYAPEAVRRLRVLEATLSERETALRGLLLRAEDLAQRQDSIRREQRNMSSLLTALLNWCKERDSDECPSPFRKDTYLSGIREAKRSIMKVIVEGLKPVGSVLAVDESGGD